MRNDSHQLYQWEYESENANYDVRHTFDGMTENTLQSIGTLGRPSSKSKLYTLWNKHRDPIINRVHALTNANSCTKYEQDPWKIVGNRDNEPELKSTSQSVFIKFQRAVAF